MPLSFNGKPSKLAPLPGDLGPMEETHLNSLVNIKLKFLINNYKGTCKDMMKLGGPNLD